MPARGFGSISLTEITLLEITSWSCSEDYLRFIQYFEFISNIIALIPFFLLWDSVVTLWWFFVE